MHLLAALTKPLASLGSQVAPTGGGGVQLPGGVVAKLNTLIDWGKYIGYGVCILGLIAAAVAMAVAHSRGTLGEHGGRVITVVAAVIIIGAAVSIVTTFAS